MSRLALYLRYATRSLRRGGQRTVLGVFCIAVGVMAVVALRLAGDHRHLLVEVSDHDPRPPVPTAVDPERDGGRGLVLVEAVSNRWGYYYPASDPATEPRGPAPAPGSKWLAAPTPPAGDRDSGKVVWALLVP